MRVVAARLRKEGWLDSRRDGRETVYVLTDTAWRLLDEGRDGSSPAPPGRGTGSGTW